MVYGEAGQLNKIEATLAANALGAFAWDPHNRDNERRTQEKTA
jgi:hypothetical protein